MARLQVLVLLCAIYVVANGAKPGGEEDDAVTILDTQPGWSVREELSELGQSLSAVKGVKKLAGKENKKQTATHKAQSDLNKGQDAKSLLAKAEAALKSGDSAKAEAYLKAAQKARQNVQDLQVNARPLHLLDVLRQQEKESKGAHQSEKPSGSLRSEVESLIQVDPQTASQDATAQSTATASEASAEEAGFSHPVVTQVPKAKPKQRSTSGIIRHGTARPKKHYKDSVEETPGSDFDAGPAELGTTRNDPLA